MKSREIARATVLAGALLCASKAGFGQAKPQEQNAPQTEIKVQTTLVMIPTVVTDKSGKRVNDLREEDFEVLRNGKPQKIGFFKHVQSKAEVMKTALAAPDTVTNTVEGSNDRLSIFVLDFLNSSFNEQRTARQQLLKFLSKALDVKEPVSLLALDQNGIKVVHDFTTDPAVLAAALKEVTERPTQKDLPESNPLEDTYRMVQGWNSRSVGRSVSMAQSRLDTLQNATNLQSATTGAQVAITLEALREIGEAFAGIPGRKSMVWATGGFPFEIDDAATFGLRDRGLLPLYERAWRALNRANIAVYPLDVEDLLNPAYVHPGIGQPLPRHVHVNMTVPNLENFAEVTGGKFCDRREDAESCFREAAEDSSDYYLIGIYETAEDTKPGWKKLAVRVHRAEYQIRSRTGYYVGGPRDEKEKAKEDMEIALSSPVDYTTIPVAVRWTVSKATAAAGKREVNFMYVLAPGVVALDDSNKNHLSLEFAALARDGKGVPGGTFSKAVEGHLAEAMATKIRTEGVRFPGAIELPPGEYTLTFAVRDNLSKQIGTVSATLRVE